jgi:hypothetical protein
MRVIKENPYYISPYVDFENGQFLHNITRDRDIGLLGDKCRFIVKTISTFANKVNTFYNTRFFFLYSLNFFILFLRDICILYLDL